MTKTPVKWTAKRGLIGENEAIGLLREKYSYLWVGHVIGFQRIWNLFW